ncbi:MAG: chemoreceptor glutamine deamidase CheD [Pseudomonadota bacterium]
MVFASSVAPPEMALLRRLPRLEHQAHFFYSEPAFQRAAVKVLPGEFFVTSEKVVLMTTLGSCVAACLHDRQAGVGGINHFMLPEGDGAEGASGRFGVFAMELLVNELLKRGARRENLEAKIFGGGQVMKSLASTQIGEKNVAFVETFLARERIPILARDVLDVYPRKICMFPESGKVLCKRLAAAGESELQQQETRYRKQLMVAPRAGAIELFQELS